MNGPERREIDEQEQREVDEAEKLRAEAEKQYTDTVRASKEAGVKRGEEAEQQRAEEEAGQRANEAAQQFADAFVQYSGAAADRGVAAQEMNAQLTQYFFNRVIENLRTQAEETRGLGQQLGGLQQQATEAGRTLTQESVSAYMDFVNSMFSGAQLGGQAAQRGAQEAPPRGGGGR